MASRWLAKTNDALSGQHRSRWELLVRLLSLPDRQAEKRERGLALRPGTAHGGRCAEDRQRLLGQDSTSHDYRCHQDRLVEGTYKIDFSRMQARRSSSVQEWLPSRFSPFGTVYAAGPQTTLGVADFDVDFSGYNYHVKFTPGNDRIDVRATIKFGGSQGKLAYEGVGYLNNFVSTIRMQIKDGTLTNLSFTNSNLTGQVELKWYAVATDDMKAGAVAKITSWPAELVKSVLLSKAAYHVPIVVGAVPFDLKISLGFSFIPAFTSKNSVVEGSKLIKYSGSGGFNFSNGKTSPSGSLNVQGNIAQNDTRVSAGGPVGFTAATEAPRLELTLGWPPAVARSLPAISTLSPPMALSPMAWPVPLLVKPTSWPSA